MANQELRNCQSCKNEFRIEPEDFAFYERIHVPAPTWCPECRLIRRLSFWNQRFLFRRNDSLSGKEIFSAFPKQASVQVVASNYWWSDKWDSFSYGAEYDFRRSFFDQFRELLYRVPVPAQDLISVINSDYCNYVGDAKNAYLCFDGVSLENSGYTVASSCLKDSFDMYDSGDDEFCYEGMLNDKCYRVFFSMDCEDCVDIWFSKDLTGCHNCFGCVNLRKKSYYIFNKPYAKEDYFEKLKEFNCGSYRGLDELKQHVYPFWNSFPVKYMHGARNVEVSGEHVQDSKNIKMSYSVHDGENMKFVQSIENKASDSYDYTIGGHYSSLMYECISSEHQCSGLKFSWDCWSNCRDLEYSAFCRSAANLFGCVSVRNKQYCILNTPYSKEDYFALREKIIRHMDEMPYSDRQGRVYRYGEFFPSEFSPFAYNETYANDFFLSDETRAQSKGYEWREVKTKRLQATIHAHDLPDHINDVDDSILKETIACRSCGSAFRIIPMELSFYRKIAVSIPRLCPNCRFVERFKFVNLPQFWYARCQCAGANDSRNIYQNTVRHFHGSDRCPNEFETSYIPERKEIVYCEQCYQNELIS